MENRPPQQETPRRPPTSGRKPNGSGASPTPPWLWLIVIGLLALIFWQFVPKQEVQVLYYPWFEEQVSSGNIKSILVQGTEIRGELRKAVPYSPSPGTTPVTVGKFFTYVPSEALIPPLYERLTKEAEKRAEVAHIDGSPPNPGNGLAWILFLLPTFVVLGVI